MAHVVLVLLRFLSERLFAWVRLLIIKTAESFGVGATLGNVLVAFA
jgi:hypothetical protein